MSPRVVATGLGVVAPNGVGKDEFWNSVMEGRSGIGKISQFNASDYPTRIAGEVTGFNPKKFMDHKQARRLSRFAQFALASAKMAIDDAQVDIAQEPDFRVGIALGTAVGGIAVCEEECSKLFRRGLSAVSPLSVMAMNPNSGVGAIAAEFGINGPNLTISTGCSAGLNAIGYAFDLIQRGKVNVMIAGGSEAPLSPVTFDSFCASHTLTRRNSNPGQASRPFDKNRDGFALGEGCGMVILESLDHALERGSKIYAEVKGYSVTNDAYNSEEVQASGRGTAQTMNMAMENAGISPEDIDYINAHGSSSLLADKKETKAIKLSLGGHAYDVAISSIKSMIGQPLGATGGLQFATTAMALSESRLPPTTNYEDPDPDCDLDYVPNKSRNAELKTALINSFGMGGNNVSLVVKTL
ncbi:MAG: beta-ketoacyl-ACP synthase II [Candidatus Omnitrophica bacterium]|nr:beta-ketoacyl-ACP synthase II [Candidatus Omnitrophota bacterium]